MKLMTNTFYGHEVSPYGLEHGRVDYRTLAEAFPNILNNTIYDIFHDWTVENGDPYDDDVEVPQWFIISGSGAEILSMWTDEIVLYSGEADIYLWGVTHYGTAWDYVLTDIELGDD